MHRERNVVMPRGSIPEYKKRLEPILDAHLQASIDAVGGVHDETGAYGTVVYAGCPTYERAQEIIRALYRSAWHMQVSLPKPDIVRADDGSYQVHYRAVNKKAGRAYIVAKANGDRRNLAYDPRAKAEKKGKKK
jgi:hypothetical protein